MSIKFILGRSGYGKTQCCISEIVNNKKSKNKILYIVPEQFTLDSEKTVSKLAGGVLSNIEIFSFKRLAYRTFLEFGMANKKMLDDIGKSLLLKRIILKHKGDLTFYNRSFKESGYVEKLSQTFEEFFSYGTSVESLENIWNELDSSSVLKNKISDILIIFKAYNEAIFESYITTDDTVLLLEEKILESKLVQGSDIWIDAFYSFNKQEMRVIKALMKVSNKISIALDFEANIKPFSESYRAYEEIKNFAKENCIIIEKDVVLKKAFRFENSQELKFLEKNFLGKENVYKKDVQDIEILKFDNDHQEIDFVALEIINLVKNHSYRFKDIAVLARNLGEYDRIIASSFEKYGISYFTDKKEGILKHPLSELILSLFDSIRYNFDFDSVFRMLKSNLFPISNEDVSYLENYCIAYGIKGYKWGFEEWTSGFDSKYESFEQEKINTLKNTVTEKINIFASKIKKNKLYSVKYITRALFDFLKELSVEEKISFWISDLESIDTKKANEHRYIWSEIMFLFERILDILPEEMMTLDDYATVVQSALEGSDAGIIPTSLDQVMVSDLERSRLSDIKAVFLISAIDGVLPDISSEKGLINENEKEDLEELGLTFAPLGMKKTEYEELLIYKALSKAEEKLYISMPKANLEGKSNIQSSVIKDIRIIFPKLLPKNIDVLQQYRYLSKEIAIEAVAEKIKQNAKQNEKDIVFENIFTILMQDDFYKYSLQIIIDALISEELDNESRLKNGGEPPTNKNFKNYEQISKENLKRLYGDGIRTSVSRIEAYNKCPFSYFLNYNLSLRERKKYEINYRETGSLFHDILEKFSQSLKDKQLKFKDINENEIADQVSVLVDKIIESPDLEIFRSSSKNDYSVRKIKEISQKAISTLVYHSQNSDFIEEEFELSFGSGGILPEYELRSKQGKRIVFEGKIDRLELFESDDKTYLKIIDYKSGNAKLVLAKAYYGLQIQLLMYMNILCKSQNVDLFNRSKELVPAGAYYFQLDNPIVDFSKDLSGDFTKLNEQEIKSAGLAKLRLDGLSLADLEIIKHIDNSLEIGDSNILSLSITKQNELKKNSPALSKNAYMQFLSIVEENALRSSENILSGNINISPKQYQNSISCVYCNFKSICAYEDRQIYKYIFNLESLSQSAMLELIESFGDEKGI